jgi:ferredoxin
VNAIYPEEDVPDGQREFIEINAQLAKQWPVLTRKQPHAPEAEEYSKITGKKHLLDRG